MLTELESFLIEQTKISIEDTNLKEDKTKVMLKGHDVDRLENLICPILESKQLRQELFKTTFRPALGHLLSLLLDTFGCSQMDIEIRNDEWIKMAKGKIFPQFCIILTNLASSKIDLIRFEAVKLICTIFDFKGEFCGDDFNKIAIDICSLLFNDEQIRISNECKHLFNKLQSENANFVETCLTNKLINLLKRLENDVINAADGEISLQNLFNVLQMLGSNSLNNLCFSSDFKELLLNSILSVLVVDKQKQLICLVKNGQNLQDSLLPPLKFGINSKIIFNFAQLLIVLPNFENRGDLLYETLKYCSSSNICVKDAADYCLNNLVKNSTQYKDVSEMIFENAHLLMFKILLAAQDFPTNPRFPMVLSEMILRSLYNWFYPLIPSQKIVIDEQQPSTSKGE
uniref:Neurochondrin-like protein n=1 Tax=Meloidogyne javanica TaxID=6303 RepID=A0A915N901_MELJA